MMLYRDLPDDGIMFFNIERSRSIIHINRLSNLEGEYCYVWRAGVGRCLADTTSQYYHKKDREAFMRKSILVNVPVANAVAYVSCDAVGYDARKIMNIYFRSNERVKRFQL